jgi:hypothetical protein
MHGDYDYGPVALNAVKRIRGKLKESPQQVCTAQTLKEAWDLVVHFTNNGQVSEPGFW